MIKSMTAFARSDLSDDKFSVNIEIRGYNSRHLDVALRLHQRYGILEEKIRKAIAASVTRGRVEIKISISESEETAGAFSLNESMASAYYDVLVNLKEKFALKNDIPLDILAQKNGIIENADQEIDVDEIWQVVEKCANNALKNFDDMKTAEGDALAIDVTKRLDFIETCILEIEKKTKGLLSRYQEKLKTRITALTQGIIDIDPARTAQEAAFIADKSDISEEIVRAKSHLKQFRQLMAEAAPSGRPLNFLLQEFNREFNTMRSKAGDADLAHIIVSAKTELEKIREQVQNIE